MSDADGAIGIGRAAGDAPPSAREFEAVFEAMQARLDQLTKLPLIRNDPAAQGLLDDMARGATPDELVVLLDRLDNRVRVLLARKSRLALATSTPNERPRRTLLRL